MAWVEAARGVLCDVDGTLLEGEEAAPGAAEFLGRLRERGIAFRVATNTTRRPAREVAAALRRAGIACESAEVVLPARLARRKILDSGRPRAILLVPEACLEDLQGVVPVEEGADWVVVGDLGRGFTFDRLNRAFVALREGAGFLALHKNPWWLSPERTALLDAGAFVAALECASGRTAEVVGKPSPAFFGLAVAEIGLRPDEVLVVGDDPVNDAAGGRAAGLRTALVRPAGRPRTRHEGAPMEADLVVGSLADLVP